MCVEGGTSYSLTCPSVGEHLLWFLRQHRKTSDLRNCSSREKEWEKLAWKHCPRAPRPLKEIINVHRDHYFLVHSGPFPGATPTKSDWVRPNPTKFDRVRQSPTKCDRIPPSPTKSDHIWPSLTDSDQIRTKSDQIRPNPTKSDLIRSNPTKSDQIRQSPTKYGQVRLGQGSLWEGFPLSLIFIWIMWQRLINKKQYQKGNGVDWHWRHELFQNFGEGLTCLV